MLGWLAAAPRTRRGARRLDDATSTTDLLRTRSLLPALLTVHLFIILTPDAGPRRSAHDVLLLLFPRSLLSGLLLRLPLLPSHLHARQMLAVLVPEDVSGRVT